MKNNLTTNLSKTAFAAGGIVGERLCAKGIDKVVARVKPTLAGTPILAYAKGAGLGIIGFLLAAYAKGKHAEKIQLFGLGMAGSAAYRAVNQASGGTLSGALEGEGNYLPESDPFPTTLVRPQIPEKVSQPEGYFA